VPFGPFLAAGALCYLFLKDAAWAFFLGALDNP
jgi:prepilin signal peptidase PulO-like enzyme (type II secretory pathway)